MTAKRRLVVLVGLVLAIFAAAVVGVVASHRDGECWPWQTTKDIADGRFCDGQPYNPKSG